MGTQGALPGTLLAQARPGTAPASAPAGGPAGGPTTVSSDLKGRTVEQVEIRGNATVSASVIRNLIRTHEGDKFDPATVEEDYQRIFGLKKFSNVVPKVEPTSTGVIVVFDVTEQRAVTAVRFRGNNRIDTRTLTDLVDIKTGQSIDPFRITIAKQAIEKLYRDRNFPFTHVEVLKEQLQSNGVLTFTIVEGPRVRVRHLEFIGNNSFSDDKLKDQVKSRSYIFILRPGTFDSDQVDDDVASLRQFYEQKGFFDVRVGRKIIFSPDQTEVMISFVIEEGRRYLVESVRFQGNSAPHTETVLRKELKLVEGRPYDVDVLRRDIRQIVKSYGKGYIYLPDTNNPDYMRISPKTIFRREIGKVDLVYDISEGKQFRVATLRIKGNTKIQDKVFIREIRVNPGDLYDSAELADAADRIRGLRLVNNVSFTPIGEDPDFRTILVEVNESQTAFFTVGAGFTSNAGVLGQISYEQRNFDITNIPGSFGELFSSRAFTGAGQYFRVLLEPGTQQSRARVTFQEPYLFDQPYTFGTDIFYSTIGRENYDEVRTGARVNFGKRFGNDFVAQITLRGEDVDITHINDKPIRALEILAGQGHHTVTGAALGFHWNTTNSPILPTRGFSTSAQIEQVGALGGAYDFTKFNVDASFYQLLNDDLLDRKTTINERFSAGYNTSGAPFFERFYGGGIGSIRGFRYRGIGPRAGPDRDPIGGDFSLAGTLELNFPLIGEAVRGVTFVDAGTVEKKVEITTIRSSIGFGFRLTLPFFGQVPLALDFAIPITKDKDDETQFVSFSLGLAQ